MDRNREARRTGMAATNGLLRRRHRSGSLRDSPEEDGAVELHETVRLRDRKKDRDRDRERLSRSKSRRGDRLVHGNHRVDGGDESTEESVNDEEEEDEDDVGGGAVRMLPPIPAAMPLYPSSSPLNPQHINRKNFSPVTSVSKVFRPAQPWKAADEMISVSVPRKARSASTKRSHECWVSSGGGGAVGEQSHRQASTSPVRPTLVSATSPSPVSPSSSNISIRKKKMNGSKHRPPLKSSSKSSSSNQDEIEIEIAEVLYGMLRQPQGPSKQEIMATNDSIKFDSREDNKTTTGDAKSRVSSPISNSPSVGPPQASFSHPHNSSSSTAPVAAFAPKRKRPRPVTYNEENPTNFSARNNPNSSIVKMEKDQSTKMASSSNLEKNSGSMADNESFPNFQLAQASPESLPEAVKSESRASLSDSKLLAEELAAALKQVEANSPEDSSIHRFDDNHENSATTKSNFVTSKVEMKREEKFQIDLMAPPFQTRSSPERGVEIDFSSNMETETKHEIKKDEKKTVNDYSRNFEPDKKKMKGTEEIEVQKSIPNKDKFIDLQLSLEKTDNDSFNGNNKLSQHVPKQQMQQKSKSARDDTTMAEKTVQSSVALPLPMAMPTWPAGLPPMGYMAAPMQGVVSMDGPTLSSSAAFQAPHLLFSQPRPKRCATHCYIARNIHCNQQYSKMTPYWPAPGPTAAMYAPKAPLELHGNVQGGTSSVQDKGQGLAMFSGHVVKDKSSQAANIVDAAQRKQQHVMLQQSLPQGATPNNIFHGPAFLFPMSQPPHTTAAAASVQPGSLKSLPASNASVSSTVSYSAPASSASSTGGPAAATAAAMSFNYPNIPTNDPQQQYLAILQNGGGYPFPIPAHVGGPPQAYRGPHPQAVPFFNGSFYSPQMLHPSQLQQLQTHQSVSSSTQKHAQNLQQQRPQSSSGVNNNGSGNIQNFSAPKTQQQSLRTQQQQNEVAGCEDSPSTADSRSSRPNMNNNNNVYGQNFPLPIHPQNFSLMATGEKKQQQGGSKGAGVESVVSPPSFAMSFASFSGPPNSPSIDMSSMAAAQNHAILQNFPEAARQGYHQIMVAAHASQVAAQQKKNLEGGNSKNGGGNNADSSNVVEEDRKPVSGKSIAFSRSDQAETSGSVIPGSNSVIDSSARGGNHGAAPAPVPARGSVVSQQRVQQQHMQHQQQLQMQQQVIQLQKQQYYVAAAARNNKIPAGTSNGNVFSDHMQSSSPSMAAKFSNVFPQNLVQNSANSPSQSQWKNSSRTAPLSSQAPSPSMAAATSTTAPAIKNLSQQQQSRIQQTHTQISFTGNPKPTGPPQQPTNTGRAPSPPMSVGSPTTSSISKGATGSPRTVAPTSGNKSGQGSTLSQHQGKNGSAVPRKSSPVGGRNVPSHLGNPHNIVSSSSGAGPNKTQMQQQQNQLAKQVMQQSQMLYSSFMQNQGANSPGASAGPVGYYSQRRLHQTQGGSPATLANSPATLSSSGGVTSDPTKAVAAATTAAAAASGMKGSGNPNQLMPAGFSYAHAVPNPVQVKPAEQKQPAGE